MCRNRQATVFSLVSDHPMKRGDDVFGAGSGFVSLNDVGEGEAFYVYFRQGIDPLPVVGLPRRTWRHRLWSLKMQISDIILGPDWGIIPWRKRWSK